MSLVLRLVLDALRLGTLFLSVRLIGRYQWLARLSNLLLWGRFGLRFSWLDGIFLVSKAKFGKVVPVAIIVIVPAEVRDIIVVA